MGNGKKSLEFSEIKNNKDLPLYTIGIASELIGTTNQTLRLYEKHGLVKPVRKNKNRFYSENDIRWILCLRQLIHKKKISIEGIKKLLGYAPCWDITGCPDNARNECRAYINNIKPCWEYNRMVCKRKPVNTCADCIVKLSKEHQGSKSSKQV